jgi:hypothetical protein
MMDENMAQMPDRKENELNRERFTILGKLLDSINNDIQSKKDGSNKKLVINMVDNKAYSYNLTFIDGDEEKNIGTGKFSEIFKILKIFKEKHSEEFVNINDLIDPIKLEEKPALNHLINQIKEILPDFRVSANYQIGENDIGYAQYWFPNKPEQKYTQEGMYKICEKIINLFN